MGEGWQSYEENRHESWRAEQHPYFEINPTSVPRHQPPQTVLRRLAFDNDATETIEGKVDDANILCFGTQVLAALIGTGAFVGGVASFTYGLATGRGPETGTYVAFGASAGAFASVYVLERWQGYILERVRTRAAIAEITYPQSTKAHSAIY